MSLLNVASMSVAEAQSLLNVAHCGPPLRRTISVTEYHVYLSGSHGTLKSALSKMNAVGPANAPGTGGSCVRSRVFATG